MVINKIFEVTSAILDGGDLVGSLFLGQITGKVVTTLIFHFRDLIPAIAVRLSHENDKSASSFTRPNTTLAFRHVLQFVCSNTTLNKGEAFFLPEK
jgi:hypothetical protein